MNLIKNLVSRNKNRIDDNNNSLDVSFITSRVLAMSFPSDNIVESLIHNNIDEISLFLTRGISTTTLSITYQALTTIAANSTTTSLSLNGQTTKLLLSSISSPSAKTLWLSFQRRIQMWLSFTAWQGKAEQELWYVVFFYTAERRMMSKTQLISLRWKDLAQLEKESIEIYHTV